MKLNLKTLTMISAATLAAGCGNGNNNANPGGPPVFNYTALSDTTSTTPSTVSGAGVDTVTGAVASNSGQLDHANQTWALSGDTGTIDYAAGTGTIDAGGSLTLFGKQSFVTGVISQPNGGNTQLSYVGVPTFTGDMAGAPATATYNGASQVVVNDGASLWTLSGNATASMDFQAGQGSATINGLNGTKADFGGGSSAVTDVATIGLNNLVINGNGFGSSTGIALNSSQIAGAVSGNAVTTIQGGFFGDNARQIGGVLSVDDTATGSMSIQGAFTGTR